MTHIKSKTNNPSYAQFEKDNPDFIARAKRGGEFKPRKASKKGSDKRHPSGERERNVGNKNGEEHSRIPKGNGIKKVEEISFGERVLSTGTLIFAAVATVVLIADNVTGIGAADDAVLIPAISLVWDSASKVFG